MQDQDHLIETLVTCHPELEDAVSTWIETQTGIAPSVYGTPEDTHITISLYQEPDDPRKIVPSELDHFIRSLGDLGLNTDSTQISQSSIAKEDWAESWKAHFHPIEIGDRLVVRPSWEPAPASPETIDIVIDPGLSFGTGHHQTTHYCLQKLVQLKDQGFSPTNVLDAGTGSGILAIAAAKLGFPNIFAFDNDPESIRVAKDNATDNHVSFQVFLADCQSAANNIPVSPARFDLVAANILAETLIRYASELAALVAPGGILLAAGILETQFADVESAFQSQGLTPVDSFSDTPWKSGSFTKSLN